MSYRIEIDEAQRSTIERALEQLLKVETDKIETVTGLPHILTLHNMFATLPEDAREWPNVLHGFCL